MLTGSNSETIIVRVAHLLSTYGAIPAIIGGLILAGMLAATMSTADSQLLAAASAVSQNLVKDCFHIKITEKMSIVVARITVVVIAVIGVFMASNPDSSVFDIVSFAWAGFGAPSDRLYWYLYSGRVRTVTAFLRVWYPAVS